MFCSILPKLFLIFSILLLPSFETEWVFFYSLWLHKIIIIEYLLEKKWIYEKLFESLIKNELKRGFPWDFFSFVFHITNFWRYVFLCFPFLKMKYFLGKCSWVQREFAEFTPDKQNFRAALFDMLILKLPEK